MPSPKPTYSTAFYDSISPKPNINVTKSNFLTQLKNFESQIARSEFIAIDLEMSGIKVKTAKKHQQHLDHKRVTNNHRAVTNNNRQEWYKKQKLAAEKYSIIQLGVALYIRKEEEEEEDNKFEVVPYNFTLLPPEDVVLSVDSVQFLLENRVSMDKWFKEGISFMTREQAEARNHKFDKDWAGDNIIHNDDITMMVTPQKKFRRSRMTIEKPEQVEFVDNVRISVKEWLDNDHSKNDDGKIEPLYIPKCNAFLRRAIYELVDFEFPTVTASKSKDDDTRIVLDVLSDDEKRAQFERCKKSAKRKVLSDIGAYAVFDVIQSESKKRKMPVVLHNGMMDLLFLSSHFLCNPLPDDWDDFRALLHGALPVIYDTKVVSSRLMLSPSEEAAGINGNNADDFMKQSPLRNLAESEGLIYSTLHERYEMIKVLHDMKYNSLTKDEREEKERFRKDMKLNLVNIKNKNSAQYHNAWFDALSTGDIFYHMMYCDCCHAPGDNNSDKYFTKKDICNKLPYNVDLEKSCGEETASGMGVIATIRSLLTWTNNHNDTANSSKKRKRDQLK